MADDTALEQRIAEVGAVKAFCEEQGMRVGDLFTRVDLSREAPAYTLFVSQKDRIAAPEGVRGMIPGESGMDCPSLGSVLSRKEELDEQGFDTLLIPTAYGEEDCPITASLLKVKLAEMATLVIHEGFHVHVAHRYDSGGSAYLPACLEEALAMHLQFIGAREFLGEHRPEELPAVEQQMADWSVLVEFVNGYYGRLTSCYRRGGAERQTILAEANEVASILGDSCADCWVRDHYADGINNAFFLAERDYTVYYPAVRSVLKGLSLADYLGSQDEMTRELFDRCLGCGE